MQAVVDATWVQMSIYFARAFRNLGIASAVPGQNVHGIIDANAIDDILIGDITLNDLTPGTKNQLAILNNVPHDEFSPFAHQTTLAGKKLRRLAKESKISQLIAHE